MVQPTTLALLAIPILIPGPELLSMQLSSILVSAPSPTEEIPTLSLQITLEFINLKENLLLLK